jgi:uncharacterized protein YdaU (DUF1376 family)
MHYYKRNLGDYAKKAGRLSMLQHGAYTLLIDACYDREEFPTLEQAIDWAWASSDAEIDAVKFVLARFFTPNDEGVYVQTRILEEILIYHKNAETNRRIALDRETKRKQKTTNRESDSTNRAGSVDEPPPNHKPLTINQEPVKESRASPFAPPTLSEVADYISENRYPVDPSRFIDFYESKGWMVGKNKMKCWKAAVRTWSKRDENTKSVSGIDPNERGISGAERTRRARELRRREEQGIAH